MRDLIPTIARTAVVAGVDGIFMEVHDNPTTSPVDAPTQWPLRNLRCQISCNSLRADLLPPPPQLAWVLSGRCTSVGDSSDEPRHNAAVHDPCNISVESLLVHGISVSTAWPSTV